MELKIPTSLKEEHKELHSFLEKAAKLPGRTGQAAIELAHLMHPHFVKEEEFALPPLGLLPSLLSGKVTAEMKQVLELTDKLKKELPAMLQEHQEIKKSLDKLIDCATEEKQAEVVNFAGRLKLHAQTEEEVSYPAAILVGEIIRLKLNIC